MRLLVVADAHGRLPTIRGNGIDGVDLVLFCGDLTNGNGRHERLRRFMGKLVEVLDRLAPGAPVAFVPGNNDHPTLNELDFGDLGAQNLHCAWRSCKREGDVPVVGLGGATYGLVNVFAFEEGEIEAKLRGLMEVAPEGVEAAGKDGATGFVLLVHDPPRDTPLDLTFSGEHAGSAAVRRFAEEWRPALVACGHIHEAAGTTKLGPTLVVNPGPFHAGKYAVVDVERGPSGWKASVGHAGT
ncbi:MAG: metallophosphoesterase [Promethearchaeota archaeon]